MSTVSTCDRKVSGATQSDEKQSSLKITVRPAFDQRGRRRHEQFEARLWPDDRIVCVSRQPLLDAARALLKAGEAPSTVLVMVHEVSPSIIALKSSIGVAAALDVMGSRFVRRKTILRPMPASPTRLIETGVPNQPKPKCHALETSHNVKAVEAKCLI
ncbi:hypothetical protein [Bradyrhizobium yuanmingense]|uniref:hypothetical protein n=1 Tax=Bradyrhizobium yuanmingense TaxID=108015 RepID=UPI003512D379